MKHWGKEIDRNLFVSAAHRDTLQAQGCDLNSIVGDPMFVNPAQGDYRVKPGSPALTLGFKNFPMDRFGVQKPQLKAIACTPAFPEPRIVRTARKTKRAAPVAWMGATVQTLRGEEFSAFGVAKDDGGIHLVAVPAKSQAGRAGLQKGDVIQAVNGKPVKQTAEFLKTVGDIPAGHNIQLTIVRAQQLQTLDIPSAAVPGTRAPEGK
jgi:membrane-associated protease RseP (regulator of RpoE activity)